MRTYPIPAILAALRAEKIGYKSLGTKHYIPATDDADLVFWSWKYGTGYSAAMALAPLGDLSAVITYEFSDRPDVLMLHQTGLFTTAEAAEAAALAYLPRFLGFNEKMAALAAEVAA